MNKVNPIKDGQSVVKQAQDKMQRADDDASNSRAETFTIVGLSLSSMFTILFMVIALGSSLLSLGWSPIIAYGIGTLLGFAAIVPGEGGVWIWKTKLKTDREINGSQKNVAWIAGLLAAISAAISTVSFFAYLLQGLMPGWYQPDVANGVNIGNIAFSWAVFALATFIYTATGEAAKNNMTQAKAHNLLQRSISDMLAGVAGGIDDQTQLVIHLMSEEGLFLKDSLAGVAKLMNLSQDRVNEIEQTVLEYQKQQRAQKDGTAVPPTPPQTVPEAKPKPNFRPYSASKPNGVGQPSGD
jgi:hypothetical protein